MYLTCNLQLCAHHNVIMSSREASSTDLELFGFISIVCLDQDTSSRVSSGTMIMDVVTNYLIRDIFPVRLSIASVSSNIRRNYLQYSIECSISQIYFHILNQIYSVCIILNNDEEILVVRHNHELALLGPDPHEGHVVAGVELLEHDHCLGDETAEDGAVLTRRARVQCRLDAGSFLQQCQFIKSSAKY